MTDNIKFHLNPNSETWDTIEISNSIIKTYSLEKWANDFSLMTAGYRDQLDTEDIDNPEVAFNSLTVAIMGEAKARVFAKKLSQGATGSVHIGGETRPHTQEFINILARIYAANGFKVHLRKNLKTTPIWYSSFGTLYEEYNCADNFTASHSQYFKGGWKPLDFEGKQLVAEEKDVVAEVKKIVKNRETIKLAPINSSLIIKDFDVDKGYIDYLKTMIDPNMLNEIKLASDKGFRCAAVTVGGSMKATTEQLFKLLNIETGNGKTIEYYFGEENSEYHKIGQLNGKNYGTDPGKPEVYKNVGAQDLLLNKKADIVFIWDPDGDRFNIVTIAPVEIKDKALELGLSVELFPNNSKQCIVYFTPNQIYFMLTAYRLDNLMRTGDFNKFDWFVVRSVSSTRSIDELVEPFKVPVADVRVGFKHLGDMSNWIENHLGSKEMFVTVTGRKVAFGKTPRVLIMYEESGGATFGGTDMLISKNGKYSLLAMREKDGMQVAMFSLSLASHLFNSNISFAEYYIRTIEKNKIKNKYCDRKDITLYDESLYGDERQKAKDAGILRRDKVMDYFRKLAEEYKNGAPLSEIQKTIHSNLATNNFLSSEFVNICFVGDGTLLTFKKYWFLLRASGTDAVLRYYIEGENKDEIQIALNAFTNLEL